MNKKSLLVMMSFLIGPYVLQAVASSAHIKDANDTTFERLDSEKYEMLMKTFWDERRIFMNQKGQPGFFKDCGQELSGQWDDLLQNPDKGDLEEYKPYKQSQPLRVFTTAIQEKRTSLFNTIKQLRTHYDRTHSPEIKKQLHGTALAFRTLIHRKSVREEREGDFGNHFKDGKRIELERDIIYYQRFEPGLEPEGIFNTLYNQFGADWREYQNETVGFGAELALYPQTLAKYKELKTVKK